MTTNAGALLRGQPATFQMSVTDSDGDDTPILTWARVLGVCADATDKQAWPGADQRQTSSPEKQTFMLDGGDTTSDRFCVWAFATDTRNATGAGNLGVMPQNQPPTVKISVVAPDPASVAANGTVTYPLYSTFELSSAGTMDPEGDPLTPTPGWALYGAPHGSAASLRDCNGGDQCFTADVWGEYDVSFIVADSSRAQGMASVQIHVNPDQAPCIQSTDPAYQSPTIDLLTGEKKQFIVNTVVDDGDPWPRDPTTNAATHFRWYVSRNGQPFVPYSNDFPSLTLVTDTDTFGDTVKVRVEALDRNPSTDSALFGCTTDQCEMNSGSGCFQRLTWSVDIR